MNINDFVVLPGSKTGTSVKLKAKNVRELQLEKVQLELENKEMEKKLRQLQSNMNREKEERKKSRAYHWRCGQAGPMTIQARVLSQNQKNNSKVSSGKVKLKILKEQIREPMEQSFKCEMANAVAYETSEMKGMLCGKCETNNALLTEACIPVGKLEIAHRFIKEVNLDESKINLEQKKINNRHQLTSDKSSSLLTSVGSGESSESIWTGLENQESGLLLHGTFNEEESTQSFQEALIQWRSRYCDRRTAMNSSEVLSETVGVCEVQTRLTVTKEPIQIEFKEDSLSYMEKLLLKKYRRTPVNQVSSNQVNNLRPVQTLDEHQAAVGGEGGGKGDDGGDDDDLTVEDMKRYWAPVFREKVPNAVSESAESSLKIEVLDDSYDKDLEESSDFLVMEAGAIGMNKQRKTEPLEQFRSSVATADHRNSIPDLLPTKTVGVMRKSSGQSTSTADTQYLLPLPLVRSPVSSKETFQEIMVFCDHLERNAVQKESKIKTMGGMLSSCKLSEKTSNPTKLVSNKYLFEMQLREDKDSQILDGTSNSQSLVSPVIAKSSVLLQEVAHREKPVSTWYWGLEGFFVLGVSPKQVILKACSSLCADCNPAKNSILFSGDEEWVIDRSLSEYADNSVVQGVLENQRNRHSNGLERQDSPNRMSPLMVVYPGNDSRRPWSTNMLDCKLAENRPTRPRPRSSPMRPLRVVPEISKDKCLDATEQDGDLLGYRADQEALLTLGRELQSYTSPQEKLCSLTCEGFHSTHFHKNQELKDHSRADTVRGWDESQMDDEEEILKDKQQVLALQ
nr:PREDICTED: zinc finger B-box domain-containing protein 1 isoform X1 [Struthio camelus australis]XP_009666840.1 PREDICTED: zinc finger B-box domain-containing protein 1 isoform X1 [Struthio camelus australis]XP_009666841.1 PREDICTED: zinc finger B-box domain-containing protein 1 isoform X1 [Struthio camelus australis]XP_009666842.1 PREDICTED: zinc finger B-box domain-containing protein 1 isoform X1 [Struthio camelus australis]